jgi:hypothetical protein
MTMVKRAGKIVGWVLFSLGCSLILAGFFNGLTAVSETELLGSLYYLLSGLAFAFLAKVLLDAARDKEC